MNGQLSEKGFQLISLRYKTEKLLMSHNESIYQKGEQSVKFVWGQQDPSRHESDR